MPTLWKTLLQPTLVYSSQLWSAHRKKDLQSGLGGSTKVPHPANQKDEDLKDWVSLKLLGFFSQQREGAGIELFTF